MSRRISARWRRRILCLGLLLLMLPTLVVAIYSFINPPATPLMLLRAREGHGWEQTWRPLSAIAPSLRRAVIAAEDNLFCQHSGFDEAAIEREIEVWRQGERPRGASTITMQTAKNILLWPGRDPLRKVIEAWLTPQIEFLWSKRRILEVYLNIIEFGPGLYGAETAARVHFGKSAAKLSDREAALLAAVLPNPHERSAFSPSAAVTQRAALIERRVRSLAPDLLSCVDT